MSVQVILPSRHQQLLIQEQEKAFYWSSCIESVLRRHGITKVSTLEADTSAVYDLSAVQVFARGTTALKSSNPVLLEGPRPPDELARFGIVAESLELESIHLLDERSRHIGELVYQSCMVRRIPKSGERSDSDPYPNKTRDPRWSNRTIRFQVFKDYPGWKPLLMMTSNGECGVVALRREFTIVLGIPLGELLAAGYAFPPLDAGYHQMITTPPNSEVESAFCSLVFRLAKEANIDLPQVPLWPEGKKFALTIRHDCDRPVKLRSMLGLLLFYRKHRIRASFGILQNQISHLQLRLIKLFGHEINLHTISATSDELSEEKHSLAKLAGEQIRGFHSHGGAGSAGFLGDQHYGWAQESGFEYVEMVGRSTRQPHAINRIIDDLPATTRLVASGVHVSLDSGMGPDQHYLEELSGTLPLAMAKSEHIVIMNHPDIHLRELKKLIAQLIREDPWKATLAETANWYCNTRSSL